MTNPTPTTTQPRTWTFYDATLRAAIYALADYADDLVPNDAGLATHATAHALIDDLKVLKQRLVNPTKGTRHEIALTTIEAITLSAALLHRYHSVGCEASFEGACDLRSY